MSGATAKRAAAEGDMREQEMGPGVKSVGGREVWSAGGGEHAFSEGPRPVSGPADCPCGAPGPGLCPACRESLESWFDEREGK